MKELRVQELHKARDLDAVQREPDGMLKASAIAGVMCTDFSIGVLGLDQRGHEFVRAPLSIEGARWLAGEMTRLANEAERAIAERDGL